MNARTMAARLACAVLPALLAACATPPKPKELEAYEMLRSGNNLQEANKKSPDLVASAEKLGEKSREEWQSNDLEDSRRDAIMANIKLKTALALMEQEQLKAKIQTLSADQAKAEEEAADLAEKLANETEKLALLQKYVEARKTAEADKQRLSAQMTSEQQKAQATQERLALQLASEQKIAAAQLSLRTADTVDASKFAKAEYSAASDMLAKASAELKQNDYAGAQASAEVAKKNADKAIEMAKPLYEQAEQTSQNKARDEALARDASAISGADVRLERRGDLQRLVIAVPQMFSKRKPDISAGQDGVLEAIAALLKKYPTYPVQIIGYTDNRGKASELLAVSAARAQAVIRRWRRRASRPSVSWPAAWAATIRASTTRAPAAAPKTIVSRSSSSITDRGGKVAG
jgi:outer membrane protein OmpA-like peptidoglycan-associated protein